MAGQDKTVATTGLVMPTDFPTEMYAAIHQKLQPLATSKSKIYAEFGGAWNVISYRYRALADYDEAFSSSIKVHGTAPIAPERYEQERDLFGFFSSGFSVFEALFYGAFAIGAFLDEQPFRLKHRPNSSA
jgi:hypothetical protein